MFILFEKLLHNYIHLDRFPFFQLTGSERKVLETICTIGCSVSLVCILLTILLQVCFWKDVKSPRVKVLISLYVTIGFTDIFGILESVARDNPVVIFEFIPKDAFTIYLVILYHNPHTQFNHNH